MICLNKNQINALLCGDTSAGEQMAMLEHIAGCDACAEALATRTAQLPQTEPPKGILSQILTKTQVKPRQESLRSYTLRVVAAMAAALILLFSGAFQFLLELPDELPEMRHNIRISITEFFESNKEETTDVFQ